MGRILIVDDEPDIELLIRQRFKRRAAEFDFVFARNGQEALERLAADSAIELVVTDINMPVMDGLTLLAKIDHSRNGRAVKSVVLSAYGDMANIRAAMNRGAFDFLTKPIDFQDFEITVRRTLEAAAAAREATEAGEQLLALRQELEIAARIQQSMLPSRFPAFPERRDFGVYASMSPARVVGGDYYDFFLVDGNRLAFVIGDVSGKGIPASLYMAVSRTLLRATAQQKVGPAECLSYMNRVLQNQGEDGMFVTVFLGILNTATGELEYAIGGHNPPYLVSPGGELREIAEPGGMVVGLLPEAEYVPGHAVLQAGDTIFLFTDGVPEALNGEGRFFGERRLRSVLESAAARSVEGMVDAVGAAVNEFAGGAPQADDITAMALRFQPVGASREERAA